MRATSDKSLRLVLSTFKNLREELCHLQDDLGVSPVLQCPRLIQLLPAGSRSQGWHSRLWLCWGQWLLCQCLAGLDGHGWLWQLQRVSGLQPSQPCSCGCRQQTIPVGEAAMFPTPAQVLSTTGNVTTLSWKMQS